MLISTKGVNAQYAVGDYGSTTSGNWNSVATWSTWNGAIWVAAGAFPSSANNTFILAGRSVVLTSSFTYSCQNLKVEVGGKLWTANNSSNVYCYVYGTTFICDGQIGDGAIFDGISFGIEGTNCTITGSGVFDASRLRKNLSTAVTNLTISRDINLRWNTASTTQLYNAADNTNFNVTISVGATVSLIASGPSTGNVCIDGLDGTTALPSAGGTFTVDGTLNISGKLFATTNNTSTSYSCNWIINGLVRTNEIIASSSGTAGHSFVINSGGKLDITGTPAWSALGTTNNSFTFNNNSTVEYSAAGNQTVRVRFEFALAPSTAQEYGHLTLSGSGNKSTTITGLYVKNNLTITGSAVLDPNPVTSSIWFGGDWINYNQSGFSEKTTTVFVYGAGLQTITCPGGEIYNILRYQKLGSNLQFNNPVDVINQLVFVSNGYVNLNTNALTVRNSATTGIAGGTNLRYILSEQTNNSNKIIWRMGTGTGTYTFPFGIPPGGATNYIPVVLNKTNAATIGDVSIATYGTPANNLPWPTTPTNVTNLWADIPIHNAPDNRHWTVDRFWEVDATSPLALNTLMFSYRAIELPDSDATPGNLGAQFWDIPISYWNRTQFGVGIANSVTVSAFGIFNTAWTLTSLTSPLPIKLLNFSATSERERVRLDWTTASEINNDYFTVEKSIDGRIFYPIGEVDGANNSTTKNEYYLDDIRPTYGISYYRLKQTDYDGQFTYSDIVPVNYKKSFKQYSVFPNPAADNAYIVGESMGGSEVIIRNTEGGLINTLHIDGSKQIISLPISELPQGIYFIEVRSAYDSQYLRLVKN